MKVLAEETGDSVQALLSRKHKAVRFCVVASRIFMKR